MVREDPPAKSVGELHYLHIPKTGGSHLTALLHSVEGPGRVIVSHGHNFRLAGIPPGVDYCFSIRRPVSRFFSAFYSRRREGRPKTHVPHNQGERRTFAEFDSANALAEALFDEGPRGHDAWAGMRSIVHASRRLSDPFHARGHFLRSRSPLWIVRQENFEADFLELFARAGWDDPPAISDDPKTRHSNDCDGVEPLSEKAIANLERWYSEDLQFYAMCEAWMVSQGGSRPR